MNFSAFKIVGLKCIEHDFMIFSSIKLIPTIYIYHYKQQDIYYQNQQQQQQQEQQSSAKANFSELYIISS